MDFTQSWDFSDVIFVLEDKRIYVNKAVLGMSSEVFRAMFTSEFKEKTMTEIVLPDKKFDDFLQLMQFLHPHVNKCVDETNVKCLLPLAYEYLIQNLIENCEKYLLIQPPSIHNLLLADKFSLHELRKVCISDVKVIPYNKLEEDPEFKTVDKETLCEIFQHRLQVHEGNDSLKNVICKLMLEPPRFKNLFRAEKHDVPEVYTKCLQYLKDTPLKQLKQEEGFTNLNVGTLNEVLSHHVEVLTHRYETLHTEVGKIASWGDPGRRCTYRPPGANRPRGTCSFCYVCSRFSCTRSHLHTRGTIKSCPECEKYICTSGDVHCRGSNRDCSGCNRYKFDEICEIIKKHQ